jgi:hypothetical protein
MRTLLTLLLVTTSLAAAPVAFPRHSGFANLKALGATGDGKTDDTVAIQRAYAGKNRAIYFPPGTSEDGRGQEHAPEDGTDEATAGRLGRLAGSFDAGLEQWDRVFGALRGCGPVGYVPWDPDQPLRGSSLE